MQAFKLNAYLGLRVKEKCSEQLKLSNRRFNIRVYGIVVNDKNELLVSDELIKGMQFTKFPGGGLEWGEGLIECLKREFIEELNQQIEVISHFYTTDYFQQSAFREEDQLISVYYSVALTGKTGFTTKAKKFDFPDELGNPNEIQRWVPIRELMVGDFKWPVDKVVAQRLIEQYALSD